LWTENTYATNTNRPDKGYEFLPRLLYWNKFECPTCSSSGGTYGQYAAVQTWASVSKEIVADSQDPSYLSNIFPQATSINRNDSSSPVLSYGNATLRDLNLATGVFTAYSWVGEGLFDTYYKDMFEMLKAKPRLRTAHVDLKVKDVVNLDFMKLIYLDGVYWRINKVVDYQPNKNQPTKVELVEWIK
jgi:hypothetical protein